LGLDITFLYPDSTGGVLVEFVEYGRGVERSTWPLRTAVSRLALCTGLLNVVFDSAYRTKSAASIRRAERGVSPRRAPSALVAAFFMNVFRVEGDRRSP
jgi:hypothetical protein